MVKWVAQLPLEVQTEIIKDSIKILAYIGNDEPIATTIDYVLREKIVNVIGYEHGTLDADKYGKYIF